MKKYLYILLYTVFAIFAGMAQTLSGKGKIDLLLDFARFQYDETSSYVEFYYTVNVGNLSPDMFPENKIDLTFNLYGKEETVPQASSPITIYLKNGEKGEDSYTGLVKTVLPVGEYRAELVPAQNTATDIIDKKVSSFKLNVFKNDRITLSDIEVGSSIIRSNNRKSDFYKNTLEIIPNPSNVFGYGSSKLGYYIELYNVSAAGTEGNININVNIVDLDGNLQMEKSYNRPKNNDSYVEVGFFDVSNLQKGYYTLIFSVSDRDKNYSVYRKKLLYIDNPDRIDNFNAKIDALYKVSRYAHMPETELADKVAQAMYLLTNKQKYIVQNLKTVEAKRKWLFRFWYDKNLSEPEFETEFEKRIAYCNDHFREGGKEGWKTDRGRIYIVYGPPEEVEKKALAAQTNPYQVWKYYNIQGGVSFYFVDEMGLGQYRLVHSTHKDEVYDPNWESTLY